MGAKNRRNDDEKNTKTKKSSYVNSHNVNSKLSTGAAKESGTQKLPSFKVLLACGKFRQINISIYK